MNMQWWVNHVRFTVYDFSWDCMPTQWIFPGCVAVHEGKVQSLIKYFPRLGMLTEDVRSLRVEQRT